MTTTTERAFCDKWKFDEWEGAVRELRVEYRSFTGGVKINGEYRVDVEYRLLGDDFKNVLFTLIDPFDNPCFNDDKWIENFTTRMSWDGVDALTARRIVDWARDRFRTKDFN